MAMFLLLNFPGWFENDGQILGNALVPRRYGNVPRQLGLQRIDDLMDVVRIAPLAQATACGSLRIARGVHRIEAADAVRAGLLDEPAQQQLAEGLMLPVVGYGYGDLGALGRFCGGIAAESDLALAVGSAVAT